MRGKNILTVFLAATLFAVIALLVASQSSLVFVDAESDRIFELPAHAREISENVYYLGEALHNGKRVEGFAIIDYRQDYTHRAGHRNGGGRNATTCFALMARGARWKTTEPYLVDSANNDGMSSAFVTNAIEASLNTWDDQVAFDVFGARNVSGVVDGADTVSPDNKNEVFFGSISSPGAVAVTIVWGIFSGPIGGRELVEWDQIYDHIDWNFGDAGQTSETTNANVTFFDLLNTAVHENGHSTGLAHPSDSCTEESMYRFVAFGETKKRTLNAGDIAGVRSLYA